MPRRRHDSRTDEDSSSQPDDESSDSSSSRSPDHKRSKKSPAKKSKRSSPASKTKDGFPRSSRDVRYGGDPKQRARDSVKSPISSSRRWHPDSSRHSPFHEIKRRDEKDERRKKGEKDEKKNRGEMERRDKSFDNIRSRDTSFKRDKENQDRMDERRRSREQDSYRNKMMESTSRSREKRRMQEDKPDNSSRHRRGESRDRTSNIDIKRRHGNGYQRTVKSNEPQKERQRTRSDSLTHTTKVNERSHRNDKRVDSLSKRSRSIEKNVTRSKKMTTPSSSSSEVTDSSESDSDTRSVKGGKNFGKKMKAGKESLVSDKKVDNDKQGDHTKESETVKGAEAAKKTPVHKNRLGRSDSSGSDSGDERGSKASNVKLTVEKSKQAARTKESEKRKVSERTPIIIHKDRVDRSDSSGSDMSRNEKGSKTSNVKLTVEKSKLAARTKESEKEKLSERAPVIIHKDRVERSDSSDSDMSGDEREIKTANEKGSSHEANESITTETNRLPERENGNKKSLVKEKIRDDSFHTEGTSCHDSEEEKEEGEISEDNEEVVLEKPLQSISAYISDISSDDEPTKTLPAKESEQQPQAALPSRNSQSPFDVVKENVEDGDQRNNFLKTDTAVKKTVVSVKSEATGIAISDKTKGKTSDSSDAEVLDREDTNKRKRPILESESDSDDHHQVVDKTTSRNNNQGKQKMSSSVSVVKRESGNRKRDSSHLDWDDSRGQGLKADTRKEKKYKDTSRYDSEREKKVRETSPRYDIEREKKRDRDTFSRYDNERERNRDKDTSSRYDNEREKKGDRMSELKQRSDKSEAKNISSPQTAKPDSVPASKNLEESTKKPATAFDITTKTGGAYIPPAKLRMLQEQIKDKTSAAYQRMSWEALKKSINGLINKVNVSNIINIIKELFQENIVRGRGLLARSVIQAQAASPTFTHVYAALVAIINTKFPQNGELILRRLILMFRRGYKRNDKALCLSSTRFIAHLVNQQVAHEVLALEILTLLLETPTDDSVEIAIGFLKECGQKLTEVSPRGINSIFERLRSVLHEGQLDVRVQYMVEVMFAIRKDGFKDHPAVLQDLDLVEEEEQFTHLLQLEDAVAGDELLNIFKEDPSFAENEEKYKTLKKEILDEKSSDDDTGDSSGSESSESGSEDEEDAEKQTIIDKTETNLIALRRTIYLTVQSSLDHNECAHKMLKMDLKPGQEVEFCNMILDCCAQLRTYEKFYGLLGQRFCQIDKKYVEPFQQIFVEQYETIHRLETNKLRNVAKFFAHMLHTDAISWGVLSVVKLTEEDTTSASRIFLKILFQELSEYMGLLKLNERLKDPTLSPYFKGIMPRDNPKNTRFSINFFTTIGLGGLTDDLRDHLKSTAKQIVQQRQEAEQKDDSESSSESDSSDSSESESSTESESEADSSPRRKSPVSVTKRKTNKESSKSKSKATDKENRRKARHKRKSVDSDEQSENREKYAKGRKRENERLTSAEKGKKTIADRLLDMAQYNSVAEDRQKDIRMQLNRKHSKERSGQHEEYSSNKSRENGEMWTQNARRWDNFDDRGRRPEMVASYRNKNEEERGQKFEDERRRGGRENHTGNSWGRSFDGDAGGRKWRGEYERD